MANEKLARRYAEAIFALASEKNATAATGAGLREIVAAIEADEATKRFFDAPIVDRADKEKVLLSTFEGKVDEVALHAVLLIVRKRRERALREIVDEYGKIEMKARGAEPLLVTSARELAPAELTALVARLEGAYGKRFEVTQRVDPQLVGGVRVTMGDRRFDGTVAGRFEELSRTLFASN